MNLSLTEEDYLKAIYYLAEQQADNKAISTNDIARKIDISAASVSDMIKRLSQKKILNHIKYQGVTLTEMGRKHAVYLIRKHRLWETFLVKKLKFSWDEVHEIAEQLEHIQSPKLVEKLDAFLDYPTHDPHGDPIPNEKGEIFWRKRITLKNAPKNEGLVVIAVDENSPAFLKYLNKLNINIDTKLTVLEQIDYDHSLEISINGENVRTISREVAENIYVSKL